MIPLTGREIGDAVHARALRGNHEATAGSVTIDSRQVHLGDCFFAIVGERHDGHSFLEAAVAAGATILVVERAPAALAVGDAAIVEVDDTTVALQALGGWLRRTIDPTVLGITGSLGKTTTKELAATLLRGRFSVHATPGNLNNHWGLPLSLLGLQPHHQFMVAEMAMSAAGEIRALARIARPDVGIITNVAPTHMQNFADLDAVAAAKGELVEELPDSGALIVNADDPLVVAMHEKLAPSIARVVRFGTSAACDVRAERLEGDATGWQFALSIDGDSWPVRLNLPGKGGVSSFLGAAAAAWLGGIDGADIAERAAQLRPPANRGGIRECNRVTILDESYNASPVAVTAALDTLAGMPTNSRHIAVLGDMLEMGEWTARTHRQVGAHAAGTGVDLLLAVGTFAHLIASGAAAAGMAGDAIEEFDTADDTAGWLVPRLRDGDTVLVKGSRAVHLEHVVRALADAPATNPEMDA